MQEKPPLDEAINKFVAEHGMRAWVEYLATRKMPDESPKEPEPKRDATELVNFVQNVFK